MGGESVQDFIFHPLLRSECKILYQRCPSLCLLFVNPLILWPIMCVIYLAILTTFGGCLVKNWELMFQSSTCHYALGFLNPFFPQNIVSTKVNITLEAHREVICLQGPKPNNRNPRHAYLHTLTMRSILLNS